MSTPNPKALVPGALVIAVLLVAVIALVAAGGGGDDAASTSSTSAVLSPPITVTRPAPPPELTAVERAGAKRDQARERAEHGASDEPDGALAADAPVTTLGTGPTGRGGLGRALPLTTPDGWSSTLLESDTAAGKTVVSVARTDGATTTAGAARRVTRRLALAAGDDPRDYETTVPMTALKTFRNTPTRRQRR